jgi:hypothetical protein
MNDFIKFFLMLFFISCTHNSLKEGNGKITKYSFSDFKSKKVNSILIDSISDYLEFPGRTYLADTLLIILDWKSETPIHIIDIQNDKYFGGYGKKGNGPGELTSPFNITSFENNFLLLTDAMQKKNVIYNLDSLIINNNHLFEKKFNPNGSVGFVEYYDNNFFYIDEANTQNKRLYKINGDNKFSEIEGFGKIPTLISKSETDFVKAQAAEVIMKSRNEKFVLAYKLSPRIEIFDYEKNKWKTSLSPKDFEINYKVNNIEGFEVMALSEKTLNAYIDIDLSDNFIYALFSEDELFKESMPSSNTIYVYDYNGKPVKKFKLDKKISYLNVYKDSIIYGIHNDIKAELIKFDIKK